MPLSARFKPKGPTSRVSIWDVWESLDIWGFVKAIGGWSDSEVSFGLGVGVAARLGSLGGAVSEEGIPDFV